MVIPIFGEGLQQPERDSGRNDNYGVSRAERSRSPNRNHQNSYQNDHNNNGNNNNNGNRRNNNDYNTYNNTRSNRNEANNNNRNYNNRNNNNGRNNNNRRNYNSDERNEDQNYSPSSNNNNNRNNRGGDSNSNRNSNQNNDNSRNRGNQARDNNTATDRNNSDGDRGRNRSSGRPYTKCCVPPWLLEQDPAYIGAICQNDEEWSYNRMVNIDVQGSKPTMPMDQWRMVTKPNFKKTQSFLTYKTSKPVTAQKPKVGRRYKRYSDLPGFSTKLDNEKLNRNNQQKY